MCDVSQGPDVVMFPLMTCQLDVFSFTFDNQRTRSHVSCKDGLQRREQVARKNTVGGEAFLFQIERELAVVIFVHMAFLLYL